RLAAEQENLRAALAWTVGAGDDARLLRLAGALWRFWFIRGHLTEGRTWLMRAVENRAHAEPGTLSRALQGASTLAAVAGDVESARLLATERLEVCRSIGRDADLASALSGLANVTAAAGDIDTAAKLYEQAAVHARRGDVRPALANVASNLGYLSLLREDAPAALETCQEAAELFEELHFSTDAAGAWLNVATALLMLGRLGEVGEPLGRSLAGYGDLQHVDGLSYCLDAAAALAVRSGDPQAAGVLAGAAEAARSRTQGLPPPVEGRMRAETIAAIESALGADGDAARAEGA